MLRVARGLLVAAFVLAAACACKSKTDTLGVGGGTGTGSGTATAATCDGVKDAVTALYAAEAKRDEAAAHDATFVDDNVAMVMGDCAKDPGRVAGCAARATSVQQLEHECLIPIDDEGTEGERIGR